MVNGTHIYICKEAWDWLLEKSELIQNAYKLKKRPSFNKTLLFVKKTLEGESDLEAIL